MDAAHPVFACSATDVARRARPSALADTFRSLAAWEPPARAAALACRKLIVSGEEDPGFGPAAGRALAQRLARCEHLVIPRRRAHRPLRARGGVQLRDSYLHVRHAGALLMAPRISPIDDPDDTQRKLLAKTLLAPDGRPLNVFATLAHRPELLKRMNALGGYFFVHGGIGVRQREIVILRTASRIRIDYEIRRHRWIGARAGLTPEEIEAAIDPSADHPWSSADRGLLEFADEVLATDTISDAAWEALAGRYDDIQRAELLVLVGYYRMLGGLLNGLGVELDAAVADGVAP
jgi:alkylhydroperoxidase family enzyme